MLIPAWVASATVALASTATVATSSIAPPRASSATANANAEPPRAKEPVSRWRGSVLTYEHSASALSVDRSAEPTYNPYYAHRISIQPSFRVFPKVTVRARLEVGQELTNADDTTKKHELVFEDIALSGAVESIDTQVLGVTFGGSLGLLFPTSKVSAAESRILAVTPAIRLSKRFDVANGLDASLGLRATLFAHRYTTVQLDTPWIACDPDLIDVCGRYKHTGDRNPAHQLALSPSVSVELIEGLSATVTFDVRRTELYAVSDSSVDTLGGPASTDDAARDVSARYSQMFLVEAAYELTPELSVALGASSFYPELTPAGTYRAPFFNRYTQFYLDLNVAIDVLATRVGL